MHPLNDDQLRERLLTSERVYEGRLIRCRADRVRLPDGRESRREVVEHPGAVAIVPLLDDGRVVLVRQYRHAAGAVLWEIPAGTLEAGETPDACAAREIEEETGYRATRLRKIYEALVAPGYCEELIHGYVATGLAAGRHHTDADEFLRAQAFELAETLEMIERFEIRDAKTICGLLFVAREQSAHRA